MAPHSPASALIPAALLACGLALSACTTTAPPPAPVAQEIRFTHKAPFLFGAQGPQIIDQRPPAAASGDVRRIDRLMPVPPDAAVRAWAADRLHTTGSGPHNLRVIIREAAARETALPVKDGIKGFFTNDQEAKYEVVQEVAVQMVDPGGSVLASSTASVRRARSIAEKATLADREALWFRLVDEATLDLDEQLDQGIRRLMAPYLLQ